MAAATLWFYLAPDTSNDTAVAAFLVCFGLAHVICGYAVARWWAVLLPLALVVALIPNDNGNDIPAWFDFLLFATLPGALLLAAGVFLRRVKARRAASPGLAGSPTRR